MRVLLSTYDSRGGVEPLVALAVRLREVGAEAQVCAPPGCAEQLAEVGVPLVPVGQPVRPLVHGATPSRHHPPHPLPGRPFPPDVTTAVAGAIRTDGATVAATLLLDAVSRGRPPA